MEVQTVHSSRSRSLWRSHSLYLSLSLSFLTPSLPLSKPQLLPLFLSTSPESSSHCHWRPWSSPLSRKRSSFVFIYLLLFNHFIWSILRSFTTTYFVRLNVSFEVLAVSKLCWMMIIVDVSIYLVLVLISVLF